ncbi:hypothetical protein [uncultured Chryseobacterium sp.]|uniref:hypothetical protein n=1 Tax=uncultured Chryseobacterium sp. TaxID=259322 RepID=UPI0025826468|nr:hypothetical protein [uncultured Chryseobacterium sp.]
MKIKNKSALLSIIIFLISLFFTAFQVKDLGEIKSYSSGELLIVGPLIFLGGGIMEFLVWTANVWFLLSVFYSFRKKYLLSLVFGFISSSCSVSFIFWHNVLASENGRTAEIISLEKGYFLWFFSILCITFSSLYLKVTQKSNA